MNRSILTIWFPAVVIIICVAYVANSVMTSNDALESMETVSDASETDQETVSKEDEWMEDQADVDAGVQQSVDGDSDTSSKEWDQEKWESSGRTVEERLKNMNLELEDLPRTQGRTILRPMFHAGDFDKGYSAYRAKAFEEDSAGAWAALNLTPELLGNEVTGLRFEDAPATEFLQNNGLENFDVIKEINGTAINSPKSAYDAKITIGESESFTLLIDRGGQMQSVVINKK